MASAIAVAVIRSSLLPKQHHLVAGIDRHAGDVHRQHVHRDRADDRRAAAIA